MSEGTLTGRAELSAALDSAWETEETEGTTPEMAVVEDTPEPTKEAVAPVVEEPTQPEPEDTPSLSQDERGRWHRKDGTIASKEEVEAFTAKAPAPETPAVAPESPTKPEGEAPRGVPFRYRGAGQTHTVEGALIDEKGGVYWPAEKVTELQRLLAGGQQFYSEGHGSFQYVQQLERQLNEAKETRTAERVKADKVLDMVAQWSKMDREQALYAFNDFLDQHPSLMAKVEADYWREVAQKGIQPQAQAQPDTAASQTEMPTQYPDRETMTATHQDFIEQYKTIPELRDLTENDWTQIVQETSRWTPAFFRPATAAEAKEHGLQPGQIVYDESLLGQAILEHRAKVKRERDIAAKLEAANKAAAFNKSQTQGTQQPTATAKATRRNVSPPEEPQPKPVSNARQLREAIDRAWDEDDDE